MEKKVFLIDDESALRHTLSLGLMQHGYDTEPCESGIKALKLLELYKQKHRHFDCVVLDLKLPDIDGLKLLKVIRHLHPDTPIILITGYGRESIAEKARLEDADGFLEKPFSVEDLSHLLSEVTIGQELQEPEGARAEPVTQSCYVMVKLGGGADLMQTYRDLYFHENVLYCDATRGDYDLVLLLQGESLQMLDEILEKKIRRTPGVVEAIPMPVETPMIEESMNNLMAEVDTVLGRDREEPQAGNKRTFRAGASSYVMLEIEREKFDAIFPSLYFNDQVVYCDCVKGKCDLVLLMKGTSFADIDNCVRDSIAPLDGILRVKECPIINFYEW